MQHRCSRLAYDLTAEAMNGCYNYTPVTCRNSSAAVSPRHMPLELFSASQDVPDIGCVSAWQLVRHRSQSAMNDLCIWP